MNDFNRLAALLAFQAPAICIVICAYVFFSLRQNGITRKQFIQLRLMAVGCVGCMLFEVLGGMVYNGMLDWGPYAACIFYNCAYIMLFINAYLLSEFCISRVEHAPKSLLLPIRIMYCITALILILRIVLFRSQLFTYVEAGGTLAFGPFDDAQTWCCFLIYGFLMVLLLNRYRDKNEYVSRERNGKLLFSATAMMLFTAIYATLYLPYIIWMSFMLVLMILFSGLQGLLIDRDELTSLSNRRRMLKDIDKRENWSFIQIDVNNFKHINDGYGHNEGDHALQIIASVLEAVTLKNGAAAYRTGGDEFAVVVSSAEKKTADLLCAELEQQVAAREKEEDLPYPLVISCGSFSYGEDGITEIPEIIARADQKMYEDKQRKKNKTA